jgi:hypothetical protein
MNIITVFSFGDWLFISLISVVLTCVAISYACTLIADFVTLCKKLFRR